jgi:hypothetical protein
MPFIRDNVLERMRVVWTGETKNSNSSDLPSGFTFLGLLQFYPSGFLKGKNENSGTQDCEEPMSHACNSAH